MGLDLGQYAAPFIKGADLANGALRKVVAAVEPPKNYDSPILVFTDGTKMGLNKTNCAVLIKAAGSKDATAAVGLEIELFIGPLPDGGGGFKDGVCLRVPTKSAKVEPKMATVSTMPKPAPKKPPEGDDYDDPIAIGE
jgi:hypothetical protein